MEKEIDNKIIWIIICVFIIITQSMFIINMQPITHEQRKTQLNELITGYSSLCYGGVCVNDNTTIGNIKDIIISDGYGYRTYIDMITDAGLSCICDGHCVTIEGYAE